MEQPTDRELLQRMVDGDREALSPLMDRHYRRLYRIALSYLRDPADALDAVQETFVKAYTRAARWDGASDVAPWLTRIAVNEAIDRYRRRKRRSASFQPLTGDLPDRAVSGDGPDAGVYRRETAERIDDALRALPAKQRLIFVLRHQQEMALEEISRVTGFRMGTVKSSLHRAVRQLRRHLGGWPR